LFLKICLNLLRLFIEKKTWKKKPHSYKKKLIGGFFYWTTLKLILSTLIFLGRNYKRVAGSIFRATEVEDCGKVFEQIDRTQEGRTTINKSVVVPFLTASLNWTQFSWENIPFPSFFRSGDSWFSYRTILLPPFSWKFHYLCDNTFYMVFIHFVWF